MPGEARPRSRWGEEELESVQSFCELLQRRAQETPDAEIYRFLPDGEAESGEESVPHRTFSSLYRRAAAVATALREVAEPGDRALLLFAPGLDFIDAFLGCLLAGVTAVPAYPPASRRRLETLRPIVADARPAVVLSDASLRRRAEPWVAELEGAEELRGRWLVSESLAAASEASVPEHFEPFAATADTRAFLQYTSGSTSLPKGVEVQHRHLLANEAVIRRAFAMTANTVVVSWLPVYHDMGLIGGVLQPLYSGARCVLMAPVAFLKRPARWLEAIHREGQRHSGDSDFDGIVSGGPNFAYELCVQRIPEAARGELDLSAWRLAFNGAEPVRSETLDAFASAFADSGFAASAAFPCYGLAESTLFVSGGAGSAPATGPRVSSFEIEALEQGRVVASRPDARALVACGVTVPGHRVEIVDPETRRAAEPGRLGEIWVSGPSVAAGYFRRPEATEEAFGARLEGDGSEASFLRTGDLGFVDDGQLFITGRRKDLIILRGRNLHPHDLEASAEEALEAVPPGGAAAFAVESESGREEVAVLVVEVERRSVKGSDWQEASAVLRRALAQDHDVRLHEIVFLRPGTLPRTSSGKVRRGACRQAYLDSTLRELGRWSASEATTPVESEAISGSLAGEQPLEQPPEQPPERPPGQLPSGSAELDPRLVAAVAAALGISPDQLDPGTPLNAQGLDSLAAVDVQHAVERLLHRRVELEPLLEGASLEDLVASVAAAPEVTSALESLELNDDGSAHASEGQRALWFLERLAPEAAAYNLAAAARLSGALDASLLARAVEEVVQRHEALRATFAPSPEAPELPRMTVHDHLAPEIVVSAWPEGWVAARGGSSDDTSEGLTVEALEELRRQAFRPFDLAAGPLVRLQLWSAGEAHLLLFVVHHLVADYRSLAVVLRDLEAVYGRLSEAPPAEASTDASSDASPEVGYLDFTTWQRQWLRSEEAQRRRRIWHQRLGGPRAQGGPNRSLPVLQLPTDRPRPAVQSYRGDSVAIRPAGAAAAALRRRAAAHGATAFAGFAGAFALLLGRLAGQPEVFLGTPTAGRPLAAFDEVVGYFVNPVVLAAQDLLSTEHGFGTFLESFREVVEEALAGSHYPFPRLADELQPGRDASRSPLFQAMFLYQKGRAADRRELAALATGEAGESFPFAGCTWTSLALPRRPVQFDLALTLSETPHGLAGSLQYNADLYDAATAAALARRFERFLEIVVDSMDQPLARLDLLFAAEREQLLSTWNDSALRRRDLGAAAEELIHRQFAQRAAACPDRVAVVVGEGDEGNPRELTYRQLATRVAALAQRLRAAGAGPETPVALCLERSEHLPIAMLGILAAGAAYVPMDPSYPGQRLELMREDSGATLAVCDKARAGRLRRAGLRVEVVEEITADVAAQEAAKQAARGASGAGEISWPEDGGVDGRSLAYLIYTSGSTGRPKGTLLPHRAVTNFFAAMDRHLLDDPRIASDLSAVDSLPSPGRWLAVTSMSFDISVLELLWTLARGFTVVVQETREQALRRRLGSAQPERSMDMSFFYFSADASSQRESAGSSAPVSTRASEGPYRLLLEGARFADQRGFSAVWTPERHFHAFGGLYPNPAVTGAAVATVTERVRIRAGSVVLPLHDPVRVAEEWSVVDNLSGGRVDLSVASGWQPADFVFAPQAYERRKEAMAENLEQLRALWRGEPVAREAGAGGTTEVKILPPPVQRELPIWVTAAGSPETFRQAGSSGSNLLTHLLGQSVEELEEKVAIYRQARREAGFEGPGHVSLMLHTFVGDDHDQVRETVREPFRQYLATSFGLMRSLAPGQDLESMTEDDLDLLLDRAFDRYFETSGLFGTPARCLDLIDRLKAADVDEIACLIDFGVDTDEVLDSLELLDLVRRAANRPAQPGGGELAPAMLAHGITHFQCTPSLARALTAESAAPQALAGLRRLLVGGEALPTGLAQQLLEGLATRDRGLPLQEASSQEAPLQEAPRQESSGRLLNMYGPTETTIWSSTHAVAMAEESEGGVVSLGHPLANNRLYVVDPGLALRPATLPGELVIAGEGVARGYWKRPALTADRFRPDPFAAADDPGARLYRTGDLGRHRGEGALEFLGRIDHQVKIRGHRIELGEIESRLEAHEGVRQAVVMAREDTPGDQRLVAYVVPEGGPPGLAVPPGHRVDSVLEGHQRYLLPGGFPVAQLSSPQTMEIHREVFEEEVYLRHGIVLPEDAVVFDVGANIGLFSLFVVSHCRSPRIFSFEPIPETFAVLSANLELYAAGEGAPPVQAPLVKAQALGVGESEQVARFTFYPQMAGLSGRYSEEDRATTRSIIETWLRSTGASVGRDEDDRQRQLDDLVEEYLQSRTYDCPVRPLSALIRESGVEHIDLLKVDVEGGELQVLDGLEEEDWNRVRQVALEVHSKPLLEEVRRRLKVRGFEVAEDEFIAVEERVDAVYMVYGRHPDRVAALDAAAESRRSTAVSEETLRSWVKGTLPEAMVPATVVSLPTLPLTPNGKIDRRALPAPQQGRSTRRPFAAPESELEQRIATVWRETLRLERVGVDDNFFETGGNSLLLVTAQSKLQEAVGQEITLVDLMRHPTVRSLAQYLGRGDAAAAGQKRAADRGRSQREAMARRRQRRGARPSRTGGRR